MAACGQLRRKARVSAYILVVLLLTPDVALAQVQDAERQLLNRLWADRDSIYGNGHTRLPIERFSIRNLRVVENNITYGPLTPSPTPGAIERDEFIARNCTTQAQSRNKTVQVVTQEGLSVRLTRTLQVQQQSRMDLSWTGGGVTAGGSASRTVTVTTAQETVQDFRTTITTSEQIDRNIPAETALYVKAEKQVSTSFLPFTGHLTLDGDIYYYGRAGPAHTNDDTFVMRLSELYPASDRTFEVAGELWNAVGGRLDIYFAEQELDRNNPQHCPPFPIGNPDTPEERVNPVVARDPSATDGAAFAEGGSPTGARLILESSIPAGQADRISWTPLSREDQEADVYRSESRLNGAAWEVVFYVRTPGCDQSSGSFDYLVEIEDTSDGRQFSLIRGAQWGPVIGENFNFSDTAGGISAPLRILSVLIPSSPRAVCIR